MSWTPTRRWTTSRPVIPSGLKSTWIKLLRFPVSDELNVFTFCFPFCAVDMLTGLKRCKPLVVLLTKFVWSHTIWMNVEVVLNVRSSLNNMDFHRSSLSLSLSHHKIRRPRPIEKRWERKREMKRTFYSSANSIINLIYKSLSTSLVFIVAGDGHFVNISRFERCITKYRPRVFVFANF